MAAAEVPGHGSQRGLAFAIAALVILLDQITKRLVVEYLAGRPPLHVIGSFVELRYLTNNGGAFSILAGHPVFFALGATVVIAGIVVVAWRIRGRARAIGIGLLLGGATGNLLDRVFRGTSLLHGQVVDFVSIWRWPIFNLADSCIVTGAILLAVLAGRSDPQPSERPSVGSSASTTPHAPAAAAHDADDAAGGSVSSTTSGDAQGEQASRSPGDR